MHCASGFIFLCHIDTVRLIILKINDLFAVEGLTSIKRPPTLLIVSVNKQETRG